MKIKTVNILKKKQENSPVERMIRNTATKKSIYKRKTTLRIREQQRTK
jgi:hypothetical protein